MGPRMVVLLLTKVKKKNLTLDQVVTTSQKHPTTYTYGIVIDLYHIRKHKSNGYIDIIVEIILFLIILYPYTLALADIETHSSKCCTDRRCGRLW